MRRFDRRGGHASGRSRPAALRTPWCSSSGLVDFLRLVDLLEIGALVDGQAEEVTAEAIERQLDGAEPHPLAAADDAAAARRDVVGGRDGQADRPAELDAIRALVEV